MSVKNGCLGSGLLCDAFDGFGDDVEQFVAAVLDVFDDLLAHSGLPEIADVLFNAGYGHIVLRFGFKKRANVVSHFDQIAVIVHDAMRRMFVNVVGEKDEYKSCGYRCG